MCFEQLYDSQKSIRLTFFHHSIFIAGKTELVEFVSATVLFKYGAELQAALQIVALHCKVTASLCRC